MVLPALCDSILLWTLVITFVIRSDIGTKYLPVLIDFDGEYPLFREHYSPDDSKIKPSHPQKYHQRA
ncbi:hypothetical protein NQ318_018513 [Aromia moschata]|uniref:Uncharacterized protein n=1 Tax=Aromia moschata TaxID=1265417 RepID=A0AAV8ZFC8_9CUCU|nr:hypothetical protein NQ318_018513 [Aromia moschata]